MPYIPALAPVGDPRRAVAAVRAERGARARRVGFSLPGALRVMAQAERAARLGDDAATQPPAVAAWVAAVKARGGAPTRMPATVDADNAGKLAARLTGPGTSSPNAGAPFRYELATSAALAADGRGLAVLNSQIAAGKRVEAVEQFVRDVAAAPRNIVGSVLGVPPWLVTALALGAGALALKSFLPGLGGSVRTNPPRRQPRGRRSSRRR